MFVLVWLCGCVLRGVGGLLGPFLLGEGDGGFLAASATDMCVLYSLNAETVRLTWPSFPTVSL